MVFSLFGRRQRQNPPGPGTAGGARSDPATTQRGSPLSAREAARLTAQKIDQIESEMIDDAGPAQAANSTRIHGADVPAELVAEGAVGGPVPVGASRRAGESIGTLGRAMAIDVASSALPGELEEAAILYANGQVDAAIASLLPTLSERTRTPGYDRLVWLVMLDLCQFAGDRARFDSVSLDFATRFETSPPVWNDRLAPDDAGGADARAIGAARTMPARLDAGAAKSVDALLRSARQRQPVADFSAVESIDADGAAEVLRLFSSIVDIGATLQVRGAATLAAAARAAIETGGESQSESSWMLALYGLRLLDQRQAFDDLSIDYCVTFEVSPPPWEPVPPAIVGGTAAGADRPAGRGDASDPAPTTRSGPTRVASAYPLSGELTGRIQPELQSLRAHARDRGQVVVDCRELRRLDFGAAGELLNEVVTLRSLGKDVLFIEPNHVVYSLMLVMGIHELSEIRRRTH